MCSASQIGYCVTILTRGAAGAAPAGGAGALPVHPVAVATVATVAQADAVLAEPAQRTRLAAVGAREPRYTLAPAPPHKRYSHRQLNVD